MLKILYARFQQYVNQNLQTYKLDLEKAEEPEIILKKSVGSQKKQENSRKKHLLLIHWLCYSPWLCLLQFTRSVVSNSVTPWMAACQDSLSIINSWGCSNSCPLIRWCHPTTPHTLSSPSPPAFISASGSFPLSQFFISGGQYWGFSFSISPFNEWSELISFRID